MSEDIGVIRRRIKSNAIQVNVEDILNPESFGFDSESTFAAYLFNEVIIDRIKNLNYTEIKSRLIRLRIFNESQELLLWKDEGKIIGRLRTDSKGEETDCADIPQVVYGTTYNNGVLTEERGTEVKIQFLGNPKIDDKKNRVFVLTRNYISESGQASYTDNRLVKFSVKNDEKGGKQNGKKH